MPIDYEHFERYSHMEVTPDVFISPSDLRWFIKVRGSELGFRLKDLRKKILSLMTTSLNHWHNAHVGSFGHFIFTNNPGQYMHNGKNSDKELTHKCVETEWLQVFYGFQVNRFGVSLTKYNL